jgi:hypothetical protein
MRFQRASQKTHCAILGAREIILKESILNAVKDVMNRLGLGFRIVISVGLLAGVALFVHHQSKSTDIGRGPSRKPGSIRFPVEPEEAPLTLALMPLKDDSDGKGYYQLKAGKTYLVKFSEKVAIDANQQSQEHFSSGEISLTAVAKVRDQLAVIAQVRFDKLVSNQADFAVGFELGAMAPVVDKKEAELNKFRNTILFLLSQDGKVGELFTTKDSKPLSNAALVILVNTVRKSFLTGSFHTAGNWMQELEVQGGGRMAFSMAASKIKDGLIQIDGKGAPASNDQKKIQKMQIHVDRLSSIGLTWDPAQRVPSAYQRKDLIDLGQGDVMMKVSQVLENRWSSADGVAFALTDATRFNRKIDVEAVRSQLAADPENHGKRLAEAKDRLIKKLDGVFGKGSVSHEERKKIFAELAENLKAHPEEVGNYLSLIYVYPSGTPIRRMLIGSLGYLGTPEAQRALVTIYKNAAPNEIEKNKILIEMNLAPQALTRETKSFLLGLYQNPKDRNEERTAGLALGSSLSRVKDEALVAKLRSDYATTTDSFRKAYLLQVMGNDHSGNFTPELVAAAKNQKQLQSRISAYQALSFSSDPVADQVLLSAVKTEKNPEAMRKLYFTIGDREYRPEIKSLLFECVKGQPDPSVRMVCVHKVISMRSDQETSDFIRNHMSVEKDARVKARFAEALASLASLASRSGRK